MYDIIMIITSTLVLIVVLSLLLLFNHYDHYNHGLFVFLISYHVTNKDNYSYDNH